jgi:hypothetical protein
MIRTTSAVLTLAASALLSACVFAPPAGSSNAFDADAMAKNGERALATCGTGNVKEVNAKSFSCK